MNCAKLFLYAVIFLAFGCVSGFAYGKIRRQMEEGGPAK
jgi:NhaP-type Na+/H+ or K+/H+ antiporter